MSSDRVALPQSEGGLAAARSAVHGVRRSRDLDPAIAERLLAEADVPAHHPIEVIVVVRRRVEGEGVPSLDQLSDVDPNLRLRLTHDEHTARYGANPSDIELVVRFARDFNLRVADAVGRVPQGSNDADFLEACAVRRMVRLSGPSDEVSRAFGVELKYHMDAGELHRSHAGEVSVPSDVAEVVEWVFGLETHKHPRASHAIAGLRGPRAKLESVGFRTFSANRLAELYEFPEWLDGSGECIGIIAPFGGYDPADVKLFCEDLGIAQPEIADVGGPNAPDYYDRINPMANFETTLDIQVAMGMATGARVAAYFPLEPSDHNDAFPKRLYEALNHAIHDEINRPSVLSISWGGSEMAWKPGDVQQLNDLLFDAALMGITVCVASGDSGVGPPAGTGHVAAPPFTNYPASSPYVLACGGTSVATTGPNARHNETVWNDLVRTLEISYPDSNRTCPPSCNGAGASGGGISGLHKRPAYQDAAEVPMKSRIEWVDGDATLIEPTAGRGVPDVAANADLMSGFEIFFSGDEAVGGGTSAAAPMWAGLVARINQGLGAPVGFLNSFLYRAQLEEGLEVCRSITRGNNGGYEARPGWDPCTGLGVPRGKSLLQALSKLNA